MASTGSATTSDSPGLAPAAGALGRMQAEREQLTVTLRGLAAELDELDRQLSEMSWPHPTQFPGASPAPSERRALLSRRAQLNLRLRGLARQLNDLDRTLSALKGYEEWTPDRVGVCPHCGYPSLGSGLCAYCRPFLAG